MAAAMMRRLMATRGRSSPSSSDRWRISSFWLTVLFGVLGTVVLQFIAKRQAPLDRRELLEERYAGGEIGRKQYLQKKRDLEEGLSGASDPSPPFFLGLSFVLHLTRAQRGYRRPRSFSARPSRAQDRTVTGPV